VSYSVSCSNLISSLLSVLICRSPQWTEEHWNILHIINIVTTVTGLILSLTSIITRLTHPKYCMQTIVFIFLISSAILSLTSLIVELLPTSTSRCHSNTVPLDSSDGPSACAAQALIMLYILLVGCMAWCVELINLTTKMWFKKPDITYTHAIVNVVLTLGIPLIPTVITGAMGEYGYSGIYPFCMPSRGDFRTLQFMGHAVDSYNFLPAVICILLGSFALIPVIYAVGTTVTESYRIESDKSMLSTRSLRINKSSSKHVLSSIPVPSTVTPVPNSSKSKFLIDMEELPRGLIIVCWNKLELIWSPIQHALPVFVLWTTVAILRMYALHNSEKFHQQFENWVTCTFEHTRGSTTYVNDDGLGLPVPVGGWDDPTVSITDICGLRPAQGLSFSMMAWATLCISGQSIIVVLVHPPVVKLIDLWDLIIYRLQEYKASSSLLLFCSCTKRSSNHSRYNLTNRAKGMRSGKNGAREGGGLSVAVMAPPGRPGAGGESAFVGENVEFFSENNTNNHHPQQNTLATSSQRANHNTNNNNNNDNDVNVDRNAGANNNNNSFVSNVTNNNQNNKNSSVASSCNGRVYPENGAVTALGLEAGVAPTPNSSLKQKPRSILSYSYKLAASILPFETPVVPSDHITESALQYHRGVGNDSFRRGQSIGSDRPADGTFRRNGSNDSRVPATAGGSTILEVVTNVTKTVSHILSADGRPPTGRENGYQDANNSFRANTSAGTMHGAGGGIGHAIKRRFSEGRFVNASSQRTGAAGDDTMELHAINSFHSASGAVGIGRSRSIREVVPPPSATSVRKPKLIMALSAKQQREEERIHSEFECQNDITMENEDLDNNSNSHNHSNYSVVGDGGVPDGAISDGAIYRFESGDGEDNVNSIHRGSSDGYSVSNRDHFDNNSSHLSININIKYQYDRRHPGDKLYTDGDSEYSPAVVQEMGESHITTDRKPTERDAYFYNHALDTNVSTSTQDF
jgi:hypothetical protein